jgi:hypothetical protein
MVPGLSTTRPFRAFFRLSAPLVALTLSACSVTPRPVPMAEAAPVVQWDHEWVRGAVFRARAGSASPVGPGRRAERRRAAEPAGASGVWTLNP